VRKSRDGRNRDEEEILSLRVIWKALRILAHFSSFLPLTGGILCANVMALHFLERRIGWFDAVYATLITFFTVGYGDMVPTRVITKLSSLLVAGWGMLFMGIFTSAVLFAIKIEGQRVLERKPGLWERWRSLFEDDFPRIPESPPRGGGAPTPRERPADVAPAGDKGACASKAPSRKDVLDDRDD
jgi:hypothetical protein